MKLGFIGLGKMGSRMVVKLLEEGHEVVVWNRSEEGVKNFQFSISNFQSNHNVKISKDIKDLVGELSSPRVIWVMVTAGEATQAVLNELLNLCSPNDIIIDGGNSHFRDTEDRYKEFKEKGIRFLGIGVSGGIIAAEEGYPLMVGGDKSAYLGVQPLLDSLAKPKGGHEYFGTGGAGHFVKMVHNAIEYGYMQAIGEGFEVLHKAEYGFNLVDIAKIYQQGTLISGFMMDRTVEALENDPKLEKITGVIGSASGETVWTIEEAKKMGIPLEIIEASLEYRKRSATDEKIQQSFTARMVSALRKAFGGHSVTSK